MAAKKRCQKKYNIGWFATKNELNKVNYIMKMDGRNTISDCLRNLVNDRFLFLTANANTGTLCDGGVTTPVVADKE